MSRREKTHLHLSSNARVLLIKPSNLHRCWWKKTRKKQTRVLSIPNTLRYVLVLGGYAVCLLSKERTRRDLFIGKTSNEEGKKEKTNDFAIELTLLPLQPGTPGIPRGPNAPAWPGKPFWPSIGKRPSSPFSQIERTKSNRKKINNRHIHVLLCCRRCHDLPSRQKYQDCRLDPVVLSYHDRQEYQENLEDLFKPMHTTRRSFSIDRSIRFVSNVPVIPMAPLPGHWQSRRGPHPLHSLPCTYESSGSCDPFGAAGYWLFCFLTRTFVCPASFWA